MTIHQTPIDIGGYEHQLRFEVIAGEVTMIWLPVDASLWCALERPVNDYIANLRRGDQ